MLVLKESPQVNIYEAMLPPELCKLNDELSKVNVLLDNEEFLAPFIARFAATTGRPTVPVQTYLRIMYLKHRHQLSYEVVVEHVRDSIMWRIFCRISFDKPMPHYTTLIKLTKKYGDEIIEKLNQALVEEAREKKLILGRKLRCDTTVVESNIHYPTDASLLSDCARVLTRTVKKIRQQGIAVNTEFHNRTRSIRKRIYSIAKVLKNRTGEARQTVKEITSNILSTAREVVGQAEQVLNEVKQRLSDQADVAAGKVERIVELLEKTVVITKKIITQTVSVQQGNTHIKDRVVSIFDTDARPIVKGKLKAPVEFGMKLLVQDCEQNIITRYQVFEGNPCDDTLLIPAVDAHIAMFGRAPTSVATDRGFASPKNEAALRKKGVEKVSLPRRGWITYERRDYQSQSWFKYLQRWRAGEEAQISYLKRKYGIGRSLSRGIKGTKTWVGLGILAYNLRQIARLT
jgi:IS5 family transposase